MIRFFFNFLIDVYFLKVNPAEYAKRVGVRTKGSINIYGGKRGMFGSEPFMIETGDNVHITGDCQFLTHDGSTLIFRNEEPTLEVTKPIKLGDNVFIGYRVIIMPGVTIGNRCVIGAGSIVTRDIPDNSLAVGNPCRVIKSSDDLLVNLKSQSLGIGHLKGKQKENEIKKIFKFER